MSSEGFAWTNAASDVDSATEFGGGVVSDESASARRASRGSRGVSFGNILALSLGVTALVTVVTCATVWIVLSLPFTSARSTASVADEGVKTTATRDTMRKLQELIAQRYVADMRGVLAGSPSRSVCEGLPGPDPDRLQPSDRRQNPQLLFLFINPSTSDSISQYDSESRRGWRAPYLLSGMWDTYPGRDPHSAAKRGFDRTFGEPDDPTVLDAWGNPIVIQTPDGTLATATLVSAGMDGSLLTTTDNLTLPLSASAVQFADTHR